MELGLARPAAVFTVVKAIDSDAVFTVNLSFTVSLDRLLAGVASNLNNRTFEMLLVVRLNRVFPVVASVTVHFPDDLDYLVVVVVVGSRWRRRGVIVWWRKRG